MSETAKRGARGGKRAGRASRQNGHDFLVVGLGASAGGIRALEQFFERMPADSGMAYVVVLHLSPEHESHLAGMLQRSTAMPVAQVSESVRVEPNRVYVIPPGKHLVMDNGHIRLAEPDREPGRRVPIDLLFRTLGANYREHAIGVVLSGTGSDGTLGLRRIKEDGGISIAQEPREAEYDGMPRSAIREGLVDFVLPVASMPEKLIGIRDASQKIRLPPEGDEPPQGEELNALRDILSMLRIRTGHDFSNYKQTTILRRVTRRMQMRQVPDLAAYRQYVCEHPAELPDLQQDLLISVTNFFRDAAAFDYLGREVLPKLFEGKRETDEVRVWVPGCATGEEAYSLAILLAEQAARMEHPPRTQVFATDLDEEALGQAREGLFPETIAADVSPERLREFFTYEGGHYYVKKRVRATVLFAAHDILRDPPFSRLDLVSCRNLLIYFNRESQKRVLEIFHFGLRPGGSLFLGSAESADALPDLFAPVERKLRVYRRTALASAFRHLPPPLLLDRWEPRVAVDAAAAGLKSYRFADLHRTLLEHYAPPSVLVNEVFDVVHVSENAGKYLRVAGGEPSPNLLTLVHPDLRLDLRAAVYSAMQEVSEVTTRPLPVTLGGEARRVRVRARAVTRPDLHAPYLLVIFEEEDEEQGPPAPGGADGDAARGGLAERLEEELQQTRNALRATVEQYETSNEELRASNEELQALNEELRSASEELETSKEELQSLNEELHAVNHELKDKVEELNLTNADHAHLLAATAVGTVFLDRELNITRYTPYFTDLFNVIPADVGRPLAHLTHNLDYHGLPQDAARVLRHLAPFEREVRSAEGKWYVARLLPYRTEDDRVAGVVLTFLDITDRKLAELRLAESHVLMGLATDAAEAGWGTWDLQAGTATWDERGRRILGFAGEEEAATAAGWLRRVHPEDRPRVEAHVAACLAADRDFDVQYRVVRADGETRVVGAKGRFRKGADGTPLSGTGLVTDITERERLRAELEAEHEQRQEILESIGDIFYALDENFRFVYLNHNAEEAWGRRRDELVGRHYWTEFPDAVGSETYQMHLKVAAEGRPVHYETLSPILRKWISASIYPRRGGGLSVYFRDISERKRAEASMHRSEERLRLTLDNITDYAIFTMDVDGTIKTWNVGAEGVFGFTADEIIGQPTALVFTPEDRERGVHLAEMETAIERGRAEDERWHVRRDGSRFYASGVLTPLREGDELHGFVKVARDLTRQHWAEQERSELAAQLAAERESLERRVEDRTGDLLAEVAERRAAEERVKDLVSRIVQTQELERRRISRDLHDILGQQLTALRLNLEAIRESCGDRDGGLVEQAQEVAGRLDAEVDFMAWELRPAALDEVGLVAALENFVHEWSAHFKVAAAFHTSGLKKRRLAAELETNLYRIAQEALNNVAKHAAAKRVGVILERRDRHVALIVEDDGAGFEPAEATRGEAGMGLFNMRERAALVGGTLEIETAPGEGTTVFARVPARYAEKVEGRHG